MKLKSILAIVIFGVISVFCADSKAAGQASGWWKFDRGQGREVREYMGGGEGEIGGNYKYVKGVSGEGLRFDGFSTSVVFCANDGPMVDGSFTVSAWVALGAYPWNWCPVLSQGKVGKSGYYFGVDQHGRFGLSVKAGDKWVMCRSQIREELKDKVGAKVDMELRRWYHIAGVYEQGKGIVIYCDGKEAERIEFSDKVNFAGGSDIYIGRNSEKVPPSDPVREWATYPSWYSLDGIVDELKFYGKALNEKEIAEEFGKVKDRRKVDLDERHFPHVKTSGRFGAFYTKLKYYEQWDALWKVSDYSDIVVQFDQCPVSVMFWRGSRYSPCWVTENGKWMADQSREVGANWGEKVSRTETVTGCCEHMSDAQCKSSSVRIVENNDARVVVHWRYALLDVLYRQAGVDEDTGWGYWGDEIYTIYPDGVGVRYVLKGKGGWQETIFFNEPGTVPEDNCELDALTMVSESGEVRTYSWANGYPSDDKFNAVVERVNLKSKWRPFMIFEPDYELDIFNPEGELRPSYSHFPWWNHWPVAQVVSDGRMAVAADRAAHSSLAGGTPDRDMALYGMTDKKAKELLGMARSWNYPAKVKLVGLGFESEGFLRQERAFIFSRKDVGAGKVSFLLEASKDRPIVNPGIVIKGWGNAEARLRIDGKAVSRGKVFRYGVRHRLEGSDLIIWVKLESEKPVKMEIVPN